MKQLKYLSVLILILTGPVLAMAQPADPGGDPYAAPVNGGLAFVVVIAFLYGVYRIYRLKSNDRVSRF